MYCIWLKFNYMGFDLPKNIIALSATHVNVPCVFCIR